VLERKNEMALEFGAKNVQYSIGDKPEISPEWS
jgi:hypothetical protein